MIETFRKRLLKIGVDIQLVGNYPWVYLDTVNGNKVLEKYQSDWGFVVGYRSVRLGDVNVFTFSDLREIFKIIRKYK